MKRTPSRRGTSTFATIVAAIAVIAPSAAFAAASGSLRAVAGGQHVVIGPDITITPAAGEVTDGQDRLYGVVRASIREALAESREPAQAATRLTLKITVSVSSPGEPQGEGWADRDMRDRSAPQPAFHATRNTGDPEIVEQVQVPLGRRAGPPDTEIALAFFLYSDRGDTLWTATATARGEIPDPIEALAKMARAVAALIGAHAARDFLLWCDGREPGGTLCLD